MLQEELRESEERVCCTYHAMKRAKRRFRLSSLDAARRFLVAELERTGMKLSGQRETVVVECQSAILVIRPRDDMVDGVVIVTCYPRSEPRRLAPKALVGRPESRAAGRRGTRAAWLLGEEEDAP